MTRYCPYCGKQLVLVGSKRFSLTDYYRCNKCKRWFADERDGIIVPMFRQVDAIPVEVIEGD